MTQRGQSIAQVAYNAGFRGQSLVNAVAIALAESGGDPNAHNATPPDDSYGLYQINYYGTLGPARTQQFGPPTSLYDPQRNAQAAYILSNGGQNWNPWQSDFNNGSYYNNLDEASSSVNEFLGGATAPGAQGTPQFPVFNTNNIPTASTTAANDNPCILSLPSVGPIGGGCIFHASQGRAVLGALLLASGVIVAGLGVVLLVGGSSNITGVVGKVSPQGRIWAAAVSAKRNQEINRGEKPTREQSRQAREYRAQTYKAIEEEPD